MSGELFARRARGLRRNPRMHRGRGDWTVSHNLLGCENT